MICGGPMENTPLVDDVPRLLDRFGRLTALATAMLAHAAHAAAFRCAVDLTQNLADEDSRAPWTLGQESKGGGHQLLGRQPEAKEECARRAAAAPGGENDALSSLTAEFDRLTANRA